MMIIEYGPHGNLRSFFMKYRKNFVNQIVDGAFVLGNDVYDWYVK